MSIPANFTIVTLGVADLERSVTFYRRLGWEQRGDPSAGITWFRTSGTWIHPGLRRLGSPPRAALVTWNRLIDACSR